jgi:hypothetical protein
MNKPAFCASYSQGVSGCGRANAGLKMCEKCAEIDKKIDHYKNLSFLIADKQAVDGIKQLIEQMEAEKAALHPEQE